MFLFRLLSNNVDDNDDNDFDANIDDDDEDSQVSCVVVKVR